MTQYPVAPENKHVLASFLRRGAVTGGVIGFILSSAPESTDRISGADLSGADWVFMILGWGLMIGLPTAIVLFVFDMMRRQSAQRTFVRELGTFIRAFSGGFLYIGLFMGGLFFFGNIPAWTQSLTQAEGTVATVVSTLLGFGGGAVAGILCCGIRCCAASSR